MLTESHEVLLADLKTTTKQLGRFVADVLFSKSAVAFPIGRFIICLSLRLVNTTKIPLLEELKSFIFFFSCLSGHKL